MSRDYRMPDFHPYLHIHDMQPVAPPPSTLQHFPYTIQHTPALINTSAPPPVYEMTAASAGSACTKPPDDPLMHSMDPRKRKDSNFGDYEMNESQYSGSDRSVPVSGSRKRKTSSPLSSSATYNESCDGSRSSRATSGSNPDKKQNHSEIEKRRRDKMNTYISELSGMIPSCGAMSRKLDKLTVLRLAVAHLRGVRGALAASPLAAPPRPACVGQRDLNALLLRAAAAADAFLLVVDCARGRLLYVSRSVAGVLHYQQSELVGQSMFDILHPKDVAKVKEQLSSSDLSPRERLIDAKTMLPVKSDVVAGAQRLCPGARRSFFCRIKCRQPPTSPAPTSPQGPSGPPAPVKEEADRDTAKHRKKNEKKYCVVQCTGYLKSWVPAELERSPLEGDDEQCTVSCLVATGRALPPPPPPPAPPLPPTSPPQQPPPPSPPLRRLQYVSRHAIDGKFLFVDQRVTLALGFLPQELLGTSLYEYVCARELGGVARAHKQALLRTRALHTPPYAFRKKDGTRATIQTHFKPFRNPWTKDVECLVANNTIMSETPPQTDDAAHTYDAFKQTDEWRDYLNGMKGSEKQDEACAGAAKGESDARAEDIDQTSTASEGDADVQRLIDSQVESHKIGSAIAEEARRRTPVPPALAHAHSPAHALMLHDPVFNASIVDNILGVDTNAYAVRNNVALNAAGAAPPASEGGEVVGVNQQLDACTASGLSPAASPLLPPLGLDGNGEAAMAVIMSLLEADAGLGGPVNFSGLPWPLP